MDAQAPKLDGHPTVRAARAQRAAAPPALPDADAIRRLALELGADDAGVVRLDNPEVAGERESADAALPGARTLIALVCRMNRDDVRSPTRSVANLEFHEAGDHVNHVARLLARRLQDAGARAINPPMAFPQELQNFGGRAWAVSHKVVAVAAGLGKMGVHRNVIHPRFGNFILLGTVITDLEIPEAAQDRPLDHSPCLECNLCVAACPVGAIGKDGSFDFASCYTHNYREFMSGFTAWAQTVADSADAAEYRARVPQDESLSMWQSLAYKPSYKAAYCLAVCPAGEDVIGPFLEDRKGHLDQVVRPLQRKVEPVFVTPGSPAEEHAGRRFPHKEIRRVDNGIVPPQPRHPRAGDAPPAAATSQQPDNSIVRSPGR